MIFFEVTQILAQSISLDNSYYNFFDTEIGPENTDLFKGTVYTSKYRCINEFTPLLNFDFKNGSILYNEQWYYGVLINYNVYEDLILIELPLPGNNVYVKPIQHQVDIFRVNDKTFVNINREGLEGFYLQHFQFEDLDLGLYSKIRKNRYVKNDKIYEYSEFKDRNPIYYIKYGQQYYELKNHKILKRLFPQLRAAIAQGHKDSQNLLEEDITAYFSYLLQIIYRNILNNS